MSQVELTVLTGDIVGSSRLDRAALDAAIWCLSEASDALSTWESTRLTARFTRFRGDGWQCLAPSPRLALRATLFLRANLRARDRGADTRVFVGIGPGDIPAENGLAAATGPAFEVSGRGLDGMGRAPRFGIDWARPPSDAEKTRAIFALADELTRRWTPRQAIVFAKALVPDAPTQSSLAQGFGFSQQMVAKHLRAGGDWALRRSFAAVEETE